MQSTQNRPAVPLTPCTVWQGAIQSNGYGSTTNHRGGSMLAHRKAYEAAKGPIPDGLTIDHLCFNRRCVNPGHLEAVTMRENNRRARALKDMKRRRPDGVLLCVRQHPQTESNVFVQQRKDGGVKNVCIACRRERARQKYHDAVARGENPNAASVAARTARRDAARAALALSPRGDSNA